MHAFKLALRFLTFLRLTRETPLPDELSRSMIYFPVIGILIGSFLVSLDQFMRGLIPLPWANGILFSILILIRCNRGLKETLGVVLPTFSLIFCGILKYALFLFIPGPLRWISLVFMTTFSSGALAWGIARTKFKLNDVLENLLWASLACVMFAVACGPLGIFVLGVSVGSLALALFLKGRWLKWLEEGLEMAVLVAVILFVAFWKKF